MAEGGNFMRVGWVGLGAMGGPMAARVAAAGHSVVAYDVDPLRLAAAEAAGVASARSAAEAAADAEALLLTVATPEQGETVLFDGGAAEALPTGAVVVVMATVGPEAVERWASRLAEHGVAVLDAPMSGGAVRASTGDLLVMASGPPAVVEQLTDVLAAVASTTRVVGEAPGDGQRVKLVNQLLAGVHIAAAAEALVLAEAMGLDPRACWETVRHGAAASFMLTDRGSRMLDAAFDDVHSALDIFVKDMHLVMDAARRAAASTPMALAAADLYDRGRASGLGGQDDSVVIEVLRRGGDR
jgi:3-hydroxyisobutyrate dehydrogenase